jgi:hypothetical protein
MGKEHAPRNAPRDLDREAVERVAVHVPDCAAKELGRLLADLEGILRG